MTTKRIAYLGPSGTFTEQALRSEPDLAAMELVPFPKFVDVLDATSNGDTDLGFVAIENAIEGTVNVTLDALAFDHDLVIQREVVLDIHLNLMAAPGTTLNDVTVVSSHPVASAQCRKFLHKELPDVPVSAANATAEAAALAATTPGLAAIGPALAAENYGLDTLATDIADHEGEPDPIRAGGPRGCSPADGSRQDHRCSPAARGSTGLTGGHPPTVRRAQHQPVPPVVTAGQAGVGRLLFSSSTSTATSRMS